MEHAGIKEGKPERDAVAKNARAIFGRAKDLLGHPSLLLPSALFVVLRFFLIFLFSSSSLSLSSCPKESFSYWILIERGEGLTKGAKFSIPHRVRGCWGLLPPWVNNLLARMLVKVYRGMGYCIVY